MIPINKAIVSGYCKGEPRINKIGNQTKVEIHLEVPGSFEKSDGSTTEYTDHIDVIVWGKLAEKAQYKALDGVEAYFEGRLRYESWEDKNGGGKKGKTVVNADVAKFSAGQQSGGRDTTAPF